MRIAQAVLPETDPASVLAAGSALVPQLVFAFGPVERMEDAAFFPALRAAFPTATLVGCSTAGEISTPTVENGKVVVTALAFEDPQLVAASTAFAGTEDSRPAGERLAQQLALAAPGQVLVFAQGVDINGSALIEGLQSRLAPGTVIAGGLAGDGGAFRRTVVLTDEGVRDDRIVAVGFSSPRLRFGHGSFGGWKPFGPARKVTRAQGNRLHELDGSPALDVYKKYLGEHAKDLPASGLLFPFSMLGEDHAALGLIRTILAVDEASGSLVLAGDVREGGYLQLMHASTDALVDGAITAAEAALGLLAGEQPAFALLVSCVGRKLVMGARVDEEIEAVADVFGSGATLTGFYSYGEISPFRTSAECKLHNQTMTITCLRESAA